MRGGSVSKKDKKLSVDAETYSDVAGFRADMAEHGVAADLGETACELIAAGIRYKRAGIWDAPFAQSVRNAMREVAEADRTEREEELAQALLEFGGRAQEMRAAAFAVLLGQGFTAEEIAQLYEEALMLSLSVR